jgi:predicted permease
MRDDHGDFDLRPLKNWLAANSAVVGTASGLGGVAIGATIASSAPVLAAVFTVGGTALAVGTLYQKLARESSDKE